MHTFLTALTLANAALLLGTLVSFTVSTIMEPAPNTEELERAWMRSGSWPTEDGAHFDA